MTRGGGQGVKSRSPHGERGLKLVDDGEVKVVAKGRSPHGERGLKWEISGIAPCYRQSLPPRGAWIEIPLFSLPDRRDIRRSPHGERGLKLTGIPLYLPVYMVAPPTGSVD